MSPSSRNFSSSLEGQVRHSLDNGSLTLPQEMQKTNGAFQHVGAIKDSAAVFRMDTDENPAVLTQAVRTSSLTRGYHALGVEIHNIDSGADVKSDNHKPLTKPKVTVTPGPQGTTTSLSPNDDFISARAPRAAQGKVLRPLRRRGPPASVQPSMDFPKGKSAMELDLGTSMTDTLGMDGDFDMQSNASMPAPCSVLESLRKPCESPNLLPSLATKAMTAGTLKWSAKMARASTPRAGRKSSDLVP